MSGVHVDNQLLVITLSATWPVPITNVHAPPA